MIENLIRPGGMLSGAGAPLGMLHVHPFAAGGMPPATHSVAADK